MKWRCFLASTALTFSVSALVSAPTVNVVFPPAGGCIATDKRTYVIGSVQPPSAPLSVNGQTVTPWRTGGFLLMVPVTPGSNTLHIQAGTASFSHPFFVPAPPPPWNGRALTPLRPSQPLGVYTGETVRLACRAPAGHTVCALVGERTFTLSPESADPTRYFGDLSFPAPAERVPVTFFAEGLKDVSASEITARSEWPSLRVTGPLFETRARSEPGDGDTVGFLTAGLRLQGAGFVGEHSRFWLAGKTRFVDSRFVTEEPLDTPPPSRDLPPPDLTQGAISEAPTNRAPTSLLIVLDPGHGGTQTGAMGPTGVPEKRVTLEQALVLQRMLKQAGFRVILTRTEDVDLGLYERCQIAYEEKADAFISLHYNATIPPTNPAEVRHIETYAWNSQGERLAHAIHPRVAAVTPVPDRGVGYASFAVCRNPAVPSCLIELDFINCPEGEEAIRQPERQRRVAEAILAGLRDWAGLARP